MNDFDLLVKLYDLPEYYEPDDTFKQTGIRIVRPLPADHSRYRTWILTHFSEVWANEFDQAMTNTPVSCFVALTPGHQIAGFSCYDACCRNFFGPIGVEEKQRGQHIGRELLRRALYAMRDDGYGYAIIGWCETKNEPFYRKNAGAIIIPDSFPGIFRDELSI